jgi:hypothetical protein
MRICLRLRAVWLFDRSSVSWTHTHCTTHDTCMHHSRKHVFVDYLYAASCTITILHLAHALHSQSNAFVPVVAQNTPYVSTIPFHVEVLQLHSPLTEFEFTITTYTHWDDIMTLCSSTLIARSYSKTHKTNSPDHYSLADTDGSKHNLSKFSKTHIFNNVTNMSYFPMYPSVRYACQLLCPTRGFDSFSNK